jgi:hypothetical protein
MVTTKSTASTPSSPELIISRIVLSPDDSMMAWARSTPIT